MMHNSPFASSGMSSTSTSHGHGHGSNSNTWGGSTGPGFNDSLSQSRSHYQPGYMMSASQSNSTSPGNQRNDEVPVVQTKAKLNSLISRGPTSDFGMSSMFENSSRKRQNVMDEDAPPTNSVNDIPNEIYTDSPSRLPRNMMPSFDSSLRRSQRTPAPQNSQYVYIIVFGYPPDKYTQTVEFFKSLGNSTEADPNLDVSNCFKIGYKDLGDAMRAVRKNGDVLGGSWMIGVKWADPAQAEALVGQPIPRGSIFGQGSDLSQSPSNAMVVDDGPSQNAGPTSSLPMVGTPIRLAPSSSAFRRPGTGEKATPQKNALAPGPASVMGTPVSGAMVSAQPTPSKGVLGQVSDLIFGW